MCDDLGGFSPEHDGPPTHSRRAFLTRMAAVAATAPYVPSALRGLVLGTPAAAVDGSTTWSNPAGETAYRAAMHLHASFSEGQASWAQHFDQAARNGVHILVPTEHDWRLAQRNYLRTFHFSGWSESSARGRWDLVRARATRNRTSRSRARLVLSPAPADDTAGARALHLVVRSKNRRPAQLAYNIRSMNARGSALGRTFQLWVKPVKPSGRRCYAAVELGLAIDPKYGRKRIMYRLRTDLTSAPRPTVRGRRAVIEVPVRRGRWNRFVPDVVADARKCWPDVLAEDNSIHRVTVRARGTRRRTAEALFSYLDFVPRTDFDPLGALDGVLGHYRSSYPDLLVPHGLEHSVDRHMNQLGGEPFIYAYPASSGVHARFGDDVTLDQIAQIRAHGGLVSYNHPFGTDGRSPTGTERATKLLNVMTSMLSSRCYGMDMVEVGYASRGMDLAGHLELYDCLLANGMFFTATGVSDDHYGVHWKGRQNRFITIPWMSELSEDALKSALLRGRATVGLLGDFAGAMDLRLNDTAAMGQVYRAHDDAADALTVEAYGLPADAVVQIWCGPVDHGGVDFERPSVMATLSASHFAAGPAVVPAAESGPRYYRCTVEAPNGRILAFTNPVWHVPPGTEVPDHRLAERS